MHPSIKWWEQHLYYELAAQERRPRFQHLVVLLAIGTSGNAAVKRVKTYAIALHVRQDIHSDDSHSLNRLTPKGLL